MTDIKLFDSLPDSALASAKIIAALFDISENTVWRMARDGRLAKPVYLSSGTTRWRVGDIRKALKAFESGVFKDFSEKP